MDRWSPPPTLALALWTLCGCASTSQRASGPAAPAPVTEHVDTPTIPREPCVPESPPQVAPGWEIVGWPSVPRIDHVDQVSGRLVASTTSEMCLSDDDGRHWRPVMDHVDWPSFANATSDNIDLRNDPERTAGALAAAAHAPTHDHDPQARQSAVLDRIAAGISPGRPSRHVTAFGVDGDFTPVACGSSLFVAASGALGQRPRALRSVDQGVTWQAMTLPWTTPGAQVDLSCLGNGVLVAHLASGSESITGDGGRTWRPFARPPGDTSSTPDGLPAAPRECSLSGSHTLLCEGDDVAWASDDGVHWHRAGSPTGGNTLLYPDGRLLGVGGGVAQSRTTGRRWDLVATAPGRFNLGTRGGALSARTFWLAGTALWWTDDAGLQWHASPLPWQLVGVVDRHHIVGLRPLPDTPSCGGELRLSSNAGRTWRPVLHTPVRVAWADGDVLRAVTCEDPVRTFSSRDGSTWHRDETAAPEPDFTANTVVQAAGKEVRLDTNTLRIVSPFDPPELLAESWPHRLVPVAAHATGDRIDAVVFGNGTVLVRR